MLLCDNCEVEPCILRPTELERKNTKEMDCPYYKNSKPTDADRIPATTDEKLAEFFVHFSNGVKRWAQTACERRMIMQKNVVCKKCNNLVNGWCEKVIDSPDPDMARDCRHFCEKTNADRIRSMSDDDLAEGLEEWQDWGGGLSKELWLEWLKQPSEE